VESGVAQSIREGGKGRGYLPSLFIFYLSYIFSFSLLADKKDNLKGLAASRAVHRGAGQRKGVEGKKRIGSRKKKSI